MKINKTYTILLLIIALLLGACGSIQSKEHNHKKKTIDNLQVNNQEYLLQSVLWQQKSSEYKALSYQAFNLARLQLDKILEVTTLEEKPLAIITDIDETILDNSPFFGKIIELNEGFSKERWVEWGKQLKANPVPGSLEFFLYAKNKNVEVFYISNRNQGQLNETMENLKMVGFPFANKVHVFLKQESSGKQLRRQKVMKTHNVIMLLGDNLSDFSELFDVNSTIKRNKLADSLRLEFGQKFIVLPNPIYGDWEGRGLYEGNYDKTPKEKNILRRSSLNSY